MPAPTAGRPSASTYPPQRSQPVPAQQPFYAPPVQQYAGGQRYGPPQQYGPAQQWVPQRPGQPVPGLAPTVPPRPPAAPQPGFFQRWNRRRRIASLVIGVVVLSVRLATGNLDFGDGPTDSRAVVLPDTLGSSAQSTHATAVAAADQTRAQTAEWWPGRSTGVAYYESSSPTAAGRSASYRGSAGAHVLAVRGKFHGKGDADLFNRADKIGLEIEHEKARFGADTCAWTTGRSTMTVCWRETDRLSVSVLMLDGTPAAETAQLLDEAWAAVA